MLAKGRKEKGDPETATGCLSRYTIGISHLGCGCTSRKALQLCIVQSLEWCDEATTASGLSGVDGERGRDSVCLPLGVFPSARAMRHYIEEMQIRSRMAESTRYRSQIRLVGAGLVMCSFGGSYHCS